MTLLGLLLLVLVGAVCGLVAEMLVGYSPGGFLASVVVGFIGAFIGGWLARTIGLPSFLAVNIEGHVIEMFWAVIGAVLFLIVLAMIRRATYGRPPV